MVFIQRPLRYAHSEGHTNVCFSDDGKYIVTCGSEGDVRIWKGFDDEEPVDKCVGDKAYAVVVKGEKMYVGTSNNYVQSFTFPDPELDGVVTRFKAPVTCIDASFGGNFVVCGSQDMEIHVTEAGSLSSVLTDHKAPVLSIAVDPKGEYFASSSCDGSVKVWKMTNGNEVVSSWDCVPKSNSIESSPTQCKISWSPGSGYLLAVPDNKEVVLYERNTWKKSTSITIPNMDDKQFVSVCSFSPCGQYLALSTTDKKLFIWNVKKGKLEETMETKEAQVCSIAWNPSKREKYEIVFCNYEGYLGFIEYNPSNFESIIEMEVDGMRDEVPSQSDNAGFPEDDDEFAVSVEKIKADLGFNPDGSFVENRNRDRSRSKSRSRSRSVSRSSLRSCSPQPILPKIVMQPPFQPSSTPTCLQYRFMVWNDVGIIEQTNTEDDQAISIKFHDSSFHYPFRITNELNYSMAALSADAVVFAGEKLDEKPSYLGCHPLKTGLEWFTELPEDEEAMAVAAGIRWVAVATNMQTLRLFTIGGNQREVVSLPGPIVCLAGYKNLLAAVFHLSSGVGGHQWLGYSLMEIRSTDICRFLVQSQPLPITPSSTLKWMGFSDCGALCTSDSSGYVRLLTPAQGWHPICNTRKNVRGVSDHYFVLGINECLQTIKVIFCKGSDYPSVIPVPYMTEIPWKLPLCGSLEEKGGLEEVLWRSKLASHCLDSGHLDNESDILVEARKKNSIEINRSTMKLFSIACLENHSLRALEVCQLSNSTLLMERAMQYAHVQNKTALAEQISELVVEKKSQEENGVIDSSSNMYSNSIADRNIHESVLSYVSHRFSNSSRQGQESNGYHHIPSADSHGYSYDSSSQDMFAETLENKTDSPSSDIQKKKLSPYAGRLSKEDTSLIRKRVLNPFKKVPEKSEPNKLLSSTPTASKTNKTLTGILKKSKVDQDKLSTSIGDINSSKSDFPPFKEWFNNEKEKFQRDNPNFSIAQITKIALKKYKELKSSSQSFSDVTLSVNETQNEADMESTKENCNEILDDANSPASEIQRKRKFESEIEEDNIEPKNKKVDEPQSKKSLNSNKKPSEDITLKKGTVKSASKLTGFFHKK